MEERFEQEDLKKAINTVLEGGIILFKDEIGWHYGVSSVDENAVLKLFSLNQPLLNYELLTNNEHKLSFFANNINDLVYDIIEMNDKPTTILLDNKKNIHTKIMNSNEIGFRKTENSLLVYLCNRLKQPLFSVLINNTDKYYESLAKSPNFTENFCDYLVTFNSEKSYDFRNRDILKIEEDGKFKIIIA